MNRQPFIRDGVCGATLLRCRDAKRRKENELRTMERGEVAGIMHFADLRSQSPKYASTYLCYSDSFETLANDGWQVTQVSEDDSPPVSPPKKQKASTAPEEKQHITRSGGRW